MSMTPSRSDGCVFCDIVALEAPAKIVREWDDALAIEPLDPVVRGHLLVLPKVHVETFFSSPDVSAATMRRAAEMVHGVERWMDPRDHNVITSAGRWATQTVMHLHVHIVPREHGDGLLLPWSDQKSRYNNPPTDIYPPCENDSAITAAFRSSGDVSDDGNRTAPLGLSDGPCSAKSARAPGTAITETPDQTTDVDHEHVYRCQDCGEIGRAPSHPSPSDAPDADQSRPLRPESAR